MQLEIVEQAYEVRNKLDKLDTLVDNLNESDAEVLLETYKSINIILKGQINCLTKRSHLRLIKE